jgi:dihydrofolate reductase
MAGPTRIEGYAIVSEDGMLATADGVMPDFIKFDADQKFFSDGLDRLDVVLHGQNSHEGQPRSPQRRRLVLTRSVKATAPNPDFPNALHWNPAGASLEQAMAALGVRSGSVAVIGGTSVFGMFLDRYDAFYLTRAPKGLIPGGIPVFPDVPAQTPEQVLQAHGLVAGERSILDANKNLAVVAWERKR